MVVQLFSIKNVTFEICFPFFNVLRFFSPTFLVQANIAADALRGAIGIKYIPAFIVYLFIVVPVGASPLPLRPFRGRVFFLFHFLSSN